MPRATPEIPVRPERRRWGEFCAVAAMTLATLAVYWPPEARPGSVQLGLDYLQLHARRMEFAREALFGAEGTLPGWYPRELLGTPFWSNLQSFPLIPSRLLVLLAFDPSGPSTYAIAVSVSAVLAALFTYLYARRIGIDLAGAAAAGWTFACAGYFASRVAAGHLPLLEAYPALPFCLWATESLAQAREQGRSLRKWLAVLALGCTCVVLAGHPQLPAYAIAAAAAYALWRGGLPGALRAWAAIALGVGCAAFALVPMALLIGRSTRVLALSAPVNDLALPYGRLAAFFLPWRDGAPPQLARGRESPFAGYPNAAYFWDTVNYVGWAPWIALALLACVLARRKLDRRGVRIGVFVAGLGAVGVALALPFVREITSAVPGTFLRSPARWIYLTELALALGLGAGVRFTLLVAPRVVGVAVVTLALAAHALDLGSHDREFIRRSRSGRLRYRSRKPASRPISRRSERRSTMRCSFGSTAASTTSGSSTR